jgi:UDP-2,3-diacylglucosamine hydrolase
MKESHLTAAALEADKVIILEKAAVVEQARAWGISLLGFA